MTLETDLADNVSFEMCSFSIDRADACNASDASMRRNVCNSINIPFKAVDMLGDEVFSYDIVNTF